MQRDQRSGTLHVLASPSLCGNEQVTHQEATTCLQLVKHAAVSACSRQRLQPQRRVPDWSSAVTMSGTRSQRDSDAPETIHFCRCGLETADPRSEAADPLPKESFYHALRVRCDYQTRYSYFYSCTLYCRSTADLTLQISTHRWTPSTSTLKSLSSHRPGGALDRPTGSGDCRSEIFCL